VGVLFAVRDGARTAIRFALAALAVIAVTSAPVLATEPVALIQNTIMFPLGLTRTVSPAASPLPGHLLAATGPAGHVAAVALLVTAACVLAGVLLRRPPRTLPGAAGFLALALTVMFVLAPASRWGYFVYPLGIWAWLALARMSAGRDQNTGRDAGMGIRARERGRRWLPAWSGRSRPRPPCPGTGSPRGAARAAAPTRNHPAESPAG